MLLDMEWAVVHVKIGTEIEASRKILAAGLDTYCPKVSTKTNNRYSTNQYDRFRIVRSALFPGYFFVKINKQFRSSPVPASIEADLKLLRASDGRLLTITEDEVMNIKLTENEAMNKPEEPSVWKKNQTVRILGQAFEGTSGNIIDVRAKSALVSFDREGRSIVFSVRLSSLRKA